MYKYYFPITVGGKRYDHGTNQLPTPEIKKQAKEELERLLGYRNANYWDPNDPNEALYAALRGHG